MTGVDGETEPCGIAGGKCAGCDDGLAEHEKRFGGVPPVVLIRWKGNGMDMDSTLSRRYCVTTPFPGWNHGLG